MYSGIITDAARAFPEAAVPSAEGYYDDMISLCDSIYRGEPPWKIVRRSGLYGKSDREMSMVNAAKVLCDQMADMTFGQQADIIVSDREKQDYLNRVLQKNAFWDRMTGFFSRAYALGGGAVRVYIADGEPVLDYLGAESFIPMGWSSRAMEEGIFRSVIRRGGKYYRLLEYHNRNEEGNTRVRSRLFVSDSRYELGSEEDTAVLGVQPEVNYPFAVPMFSYFHPACGNNISDSCMGISCFYNCRDTLRAIDIAFDSLVREFILGRKRIIVPSSCIRTVVDPESGQTRRYFDADDEVYQALRCEDESELKIIDNTAELRIDEHVSAINALLNILCFQTGLSSGTLSFGTSTGVRTAAEISSQENRTQRTMNSNRNIAAEFIEGIANAVLAAGTALGHISGGEVSVKVSFSKELDNDIDKNIDRLLKLYREGIRTKEEVRAETEQYIGETMRE